MLTLHFPHTVDGIRWTEDRSIGVSVGSDGRAWLVLGDGTLSARADVDLWALAEHLGRVGSVAELWADLNPPPP